jgi:hypothetical protein
MFIGIETLHFCVRAAVAAYNKGNITKCEMLQRLDIKPRKYTTKSKAVTD